jgi:ATP-dependent Lon protease
MAQTFFERLVSTGLEAPVIPLKDMVLFPDAVTPIFIERESSKKAANSAITNNRQAIIVTQKDKNNQNPEAKDLYKTGVLASIPQIRTIQGDILVVIADGLKKVRITEYTQKNPFLKARYEELKTTKKQTPEEEALFRSAFDQFKQIIQLGKDIPLDGVISIFDVKDPIKTTNLISFALDMDIKEKQNLLEKNDFKEQLIFLSTYLAKEISILKASQKIQHKTSEEIGKMQKEVYLREQLKTIEQELGMDEKNEMNELLNKINKANLSKQAYEVAITEYNRLKKMPSFSPEVSWIRTYLDWLTDLPWNKKTKNNIDIKEAEKILNQDHWGLEKVKEMVLEYLALIQHSGKVRGPILLFVGPPGTGKTSIGQSIAKSMNKKFIRISLGGVRDESEIKGFRRTYVGAQPGRIIQGIKNAGSNNPVFMLDELDKVGSDFRGDPSAALLEALDPAQNNNFQDHYIEVPFDLSDVLFIGTANILDTIPPALRDRLEVIPFSGYTYNEKLAIAKNYLIPKLIKSYNLTDYKISIDDKGLETIIKNYTREAGVRNLEREIASVLRKIVRKITEKNLPSNLKLSTEDICKYLGPVKFLENSKEQKDEIGVCPALAWSEAGGLILFVESQAFPGKGNLTLTGKLGDVMKESAQAAFAYARKNAQKYGLDNNFYNDTDIHIHVPEGAIPKDGPSAGIAIATSIISTLVKKPIKKEVAMTGEITLRGKILAIGGVKEKVLAGEAMGAKTIILPADNKKDLPEIPNDIKNKLDIRLVNHMDEVIKIAI